MSEGDPRQAGRIALTFDNLGEAAEIERGRWTGKVPIGSDPSVTQALPWLLHELDSHRIRATFFVEAINCELNPVAVREIADRGHELAVHGWRHEEWAALTPDQERGLLARCRAAFAKLGLAVAGFRPPGGEPTLRTASLLSDAGFTWWSPAANTPRPDDRDRIPVQVPFEWELVDAYHLMERFDRVRAVRGDDPRPLPPVAAAQRLTGALERSRGEARIIVLHPFLMLDPGWRIEVQRILSLLAGWTRAGTTALVEAGDLARAHPRVAR